MKKEALTIELLFAVAFAPFVIRYSFIPFRLEYNGISRHAVKKHGAVFERI